MTTDTQSMTNETSNAAIETEKPVDSQVAKPDDSVVAPEHQKEVTQTDEVVLYSKEQVDAEVQRVAGKLGSEMESLRKQNNLGALAGVLLNSWQEEMDRKEAEIDDLINSTGQDLNLVKLRQDVRTRDREVREKEKAINLLMLEYEPAIKEAKALKLLMSFADIAKREGVELDALMKLQPQTEEEAERWAKTIVQLSPPKSAMQSDRNLGAPANTQRDFSKKSAYQKIRDGFGELDKSEGAAK